MLDQKRSGRNIELRISYVGTRFFGWQKQPYHTTVQGVLELLLGKTLRATEITTIGSSRTDTGVHAHDQHVSFFTESTIPPAGLKRALNHRLPSEIRVLEVRDRPQTFSARYDARAKHYAYFIFNGEVAAPLVADLVWRYGPALDVNAMAHAARYLLGKRCFKSLQASGDARKSSITTLYDVRVEQTGSIISFETLGHRYLYHMVRNMAGSLIRVGRKQWSVEEFRQRLDGGKRALMGITAPASGLHLIEVSYGSSPFQFSEKSRALRRYLSQGLEQF